MHAELSVPLGALTFLVYHFHYSTYSIDLFSTEKNKFHYKNPFHLDLYTFEYYHKVMNEIIKKCCTLVFVRCSAVFCAMCIPTPLNSKCFKTIGNENQAESTFQCESITNMSENHEYMKEWNHRQTWFYFLYMVYRGVINIAHTTRIHHMWMCLQNTRLLCVFLCFQHGIEIPGK